METTWITMADLIKVNQGLRDRITELEDALRVATQEKETVSRRILCERWKFTDAETTFFLVLKSDRAVTRDYLSSVLFPHGDLPSSKLFDVHVCHMRKKMKAAGAGLRIVTEWGIGFKVVECD